MTDDSDDRFSMPPIKGSSDDSAADDRDAASRDDDSSGGDAADARSVPLPLPPPGLFARLDAADTPAYADVVAEEEVTLAGEAAGDPDEPADRYASYFAERAAAEEPDLPPIVLAGLTDAVDVAEQLESGGFEGSADSDEEVASAAEASDEAPPSPVYAAVGEPDESDSYTVLDAHVDDEPERPYSLPGYAASEDTDTDEAEEPSITLPLYGGDRAAADEVEILPHFLLDESGPLDVVAAQDDLREMAQKNRRRADSTDHKPSMARTLAEIPILLIVAAVIAFLVKTFLAQAYYIPSGSMLPQLEVDDRVVVSKLAYKLHDPRRGDIVVFDDPRGDEAADDDESDTGGVSEILRKVGEGVGIVQPSTDEFIKRVVALPGETVSGKDGFIYINDRKLIEPYLPEGVETSDFPEQRVAEGKLWVMGDNRSGSADSRVFGQIDVDSIVGRAVIKVWPFPSISFL